MSLAREEKEKLIKSLEEASVKVREAFDIAKTKLKYTLIYYQLKDMLRDIDDIKEFIEGEIGYYIEEEAEEEIEEEEEIF